MLNSRNDFGEFSEEDWVKHLNQRISLPFLAEVSEFQEAGPIQQGDHVKVYSIEGADDKYGVIVALRIGRKKYHFPLVDLEPITEDQEFRNIIADYKEWF